MLFCMYICVAAAEASAFLFEFRRLQVVNEPLVESRLRRSEAVREASLVDFDWTGRAPEAALLLLALSSSTSSGESVREVEGEAVGGEISLFKKQWRTKSRRGQRTRGRPRAIQRTRGKRSSLCSL